MGVADFQFTLSVSTEHPFAQALTRYPNGAYATNNAPISLGSTPFPHVCGPISGSPPTSLFGGLNCPDLTVLASAVRHHTWQHSTRPTHSQHTTLRPGCDVLVLTPSLSLSPVPTRFEKPSRGNLGTPPS